MKSNTPSPSNRKRGGAVAKVLITLIILLLVGVAAWVFFLPSITASVVQKRTGFALKSDSFSINPLGGGLHITNLQLQNPSTFPKPDFVNLRTLEGKLEVGSLISDRLVIERAVLDLESLSLIRAMDGTLNAKLFTDRLKGDSPAAEPSKDGKPKEFLIKHLEVRVAKIRVEDHSGQKPSEREFNVNFAQNYENVTDLKQLASGPALKSLAQVAVAVSNLSVSDLSRLIDDPNKSGKDLLKGLGKRAGDALRGTSGNSDTLEESKKP